MNLNQVDQIAKAVLYEGYMLYPYRPSSLKNRQRWNFGVLCPREYSESQGGADAFTMRTEFLVTGSDRAALEMKLRFLQLQVRSTVSNHEAQATAPTASLPTDWQEGVERDVNVPAFPLETVLLGPVRHTFQFPAKIIEASAGEEAATRVVRRQAEIRGEIVITAQQLRVELFKLRIEVLNTVRFENPAASRDDALLQSLVSTHTVMGVTDGDFVSLLAPPDDLKALASQCENVGAWPVLVGDPGQYDTLLASPIILYDYPQIAPESAGDLFDGTEIDEILSLRIMTLTDEEKREIRHSDERARQVLERTDTMPAEQFMKMHGALRGLGPVKESTP